jgi:hypothetical protein
MWVSSLAYPNLLGTKRLGCCYSNMQIIFKMDKYGQGVEFQIARLEQNRELDFSGFTRQMLLEMCILSGCDYLPSMSGMGVKRAHGLIQRFKCHEKVFLLCCMLSSNLVKTWQPMKRTSVVCNVLCIIAGNQALEVQCWFCSTSIRSEFQKGNLGF